MARRPGRLLAGAGHGWLLHERRPPFGGVSRRPASPLWSTPGEPRETSPQTLKEMGPETRAGRWGSRPGSGLGETGRLRPAPDQPSGTSPSPAAGQAGGPCCTAGSAFDHPCGHAVAVHLVSRRKRSISSLGIKMWRKAREGRISPRQIRRRTLLSQTPSMRAVSWTL